MLRTQRIPLSGTQIVDFDDDRVRAMQRLARAVGLGRSAPAGAAGRTRPGAGWCTVEILRGGDIVALAVESAGRRRRVAVGRAVAVTGAVLGEGGFVGLGKRQRREAEQKGEGVHFGMECKRLY